MAYGDSMREIDDDPESGNADVKGETLREKRVLGESSREMLFR